MEIETRRMWEGGPLRRWSRTKQRSQSWNFYESASCRGYAGAYVCDECQESTPGVYRSTPFVRWLCAACNAKWQGRQSQITSSALV